MRGCALFLVGSLFLAGCGAGTPARVSCRPAPAAARYAILLNGDTERRHKDNIAEAYRTLRALGFEGRRIFVLSARDRRAGLLAETLRLPAVRSNVGRVLDEVGIEIRKGDLLVVYGTGHGDITDDGEGYLALRRGELWPDELREELERLPGDSVVVMDQCFSGAFADVFRGTQRRAIVISSVDARHETDCEYFAPAFWDAFLHPEKADRNHDGKTSVREAFEVAIEAHRRGLAGDPDLKADGSYHAFNGFADALLN